ncbi:hypothetical protein B296_00020914 [Ensete ventricosum]|uniref:Uncharacterized protein n=1 Tax=Ensete ventricosum TaxID=4639 RepID=A0A426XY96_ENSVE|nr:hypothetical protein B296_00020914 [Ensete ventricosum]
MLPWPCRTSISDARRLNRVSLLFVLHLLVAAAAVCFFCFRGIQGLLDSDSRKARKGRRVLKFWLPPIEGASVLSIALAFAWPSVVVPPSSSGPVSSPPWPLAYSSSFLLLHPSNGRARPRSDGWYLGVRLGKSVAGMVELGSG